MVFSEPTFLFFFLPACLLGYFLSKSAWKNYFLLISSLIFYSWAEPGHLLVLLASIALNFGFGLAIERTRSQRPRLFLALGVIANIALLGWYKYLGFFLENLGVSSEIISVPALPIGISFFTFQGLSYLIDLQARRVNVQRNPMQLGLYISMFPQLIAGPIVRYEEVEASLLKRRTTAEDFSAGAERFLVGLAKKTLIADPAGLTADRIFAIPDAGLSPEVAWIGIIAYTIQIYFDFSAYSDMAIGMGRIFGFKFPENFNFPYASQSVTEFWRRWHMTLSRWFRDYLYIPLGGNRRGQFRTYLNLSIVFLATGFWHGAAWTFIFWGAWHGFFLILERAFLQDWLQRAPKFTRHGYLLIVIMLGWVAFRADSFDQTYHFFSSMIFGARGDEAMLYPVARFVDVYVVLVLAVGAVWAFPFKNWTGVLMDRVIPAVIVRKITKEIWLTLLFVASVISVGAASYSPFIYFRF